MLSRAAVVPLQALRPWELFLRPLLCCEGVLRGYAEATGVV